jgi:hypothetical protein
MYKVCALVIIMSSATTKAVPDFAATFRFSNISISNGEILIY